MQQFCFILVCFLQISLNYYTNKETVHMHGGIKYYKAEYLGNIQQLFYIPSFFLLK